MLAMLAGLMAQGSARADEQVRRQRHLVEMGFFAGTFFANYAHEFYAIDPPNERRTLDDVSPELGLRLAYLPWSWIGFEIEGGLAQSSTTGTNDADTPIYLLRGHLLAQLPAKVAPFVVIGGGILAARSDDPMLGDDTDPAFHWGLGIKWYAHPQLAVRFDGRHVVGPRIQQGGRTSHFELLVGLSVILGWEDDRDQDGVPDKSDTCPKTKGERGDGCPWGDGDGDGLKDNVDKCPKTKGVAKHGGCPPPDGDKDGVPDETDACPKAAGVEALKGCPDKDGDGVADKDDTCPEIKGEQAHQGCPPDKDGDGVWDAEDTCPEVKGDKAYQGCPPDKDGDGIHDGIDRCPAKPETKNGFQDEDGCPDALPKKIKRFTGTIRGINFELGKATIRSKSFPLLDQAAKVLRQYTSLRLQIRGHSDSRGKRRFNLDLSRHRAQAVVDYMKDKGIDASRLEATGLGPDEPLASNKTRAGRAKNRRIEFTVVIK
ncbi:MAG: OmpA family protein [Deltaproteobacteria bacterium]|nr:OmpA family protein [Deltaproteobacteria bacterium]